MKSFKSYSLVIFSILLITSCVPRKNIVYFQDIENYVSEDNIEPARFKPNDMLSIIVSSSNIESAIPFNLMSLVRPIAGVRTTSTNITGSTASMEVPYMVNSDGEIEFPVLGTIKIEGMSTQDLKSYLQKELKEFIKDPIINIRFLNFTVTILGEVNHPGTFHINGERVSLPEALGVAGDMSIFGRRDNILIVRETGGKKVYKYLDMRDPDILNSEYYYLQQHDIVYVEPNRAQRQSSSFNRNMSVYVSIASLLLSLYVIFGKK